MPESPIGPLRQFQADFTTPDAVFSGTSATRRPDAISLDYLTCFAQGPVGLGDNSQGPTAFVWRVRVIGLTVYAARAMDGGWQDDIALFSFTGVPILELDAAFDQAGRVFVCAERATGTSGASEIWAYFFNSLTSMFEFSVQDQGRTPRTILDSPYDSTVSDVLLFYVHPSDGVVYRQQRDRYLTKYGTPLSTNSGLYDRQQMNYGPVFFPANVSGSTATTAFLGDYDGSPGMSFFANHGQGSSDGSVYDRTGSSGVVVTPSVPIDGFEVEIDHSTVAGGSVTYNSPTGGDTVLFPAPTPANPNPRVRVFHPGITTFSLFTSTPDRSVIGQTRFVLRGLKLQSATLATLAGLVMNSGPIFLTADPDDDSLGSGSALGVAVTVQVVTGAVEGIFGPYPHILSIYDESMFTYFPGTPLERKNNAAHFQSGPFSPRDPALNILITFSEPVDGFSIEGVSPTYFDQGLIFRDVDGVQIGGDTSAVNFDATGSIFLRRDFFIAGIKSVELVPRAGGIGADVEHISWWNMQFKKSSAPLPVPKEFLDQYPALPSLPDVYLEDVLALSDYRIRVVFAVRDEGVGTYHFDALESAIYPLPIQVGDAFRPSMDVRSGSLVTYIRELLQLDENGVLLGMTVLDSGELLQVIFINAPPLQLEENGLEIDMTVESGELVQVIFPITAPLQLEESGLEIDMTLLSGELIQTVFTVVIEYSTEIEAISLSQTVIGGSLVTV